MTSYYDNTADKAEALAASTTPEMFLGKNLRGAYPRPELGLPRELFVITKSAGRAPEDVAYWGRGLNAAEAAWVNRTSAHRRACLAAIAAGQPCPAWAIVG